METRTEDLIRSCGQKHVMNSNQNAKRRDGQENAKWLLFRIYSLRNSMVLAKNVGSLVETWPNFIFFSCSVSQFFSSTPPFYNPYFPIRPSPTSSLKPYIATTHRPLHSPLLPPPEYTHKQRWQHRHPRAHSNSSSCY